MLQKRQVLTVMYSAVLFSSKLSELLNRGVVTFIEIPPGQNIVLLGVGVFSGPIGIHRLCVTLTTKGKKIAINCVEYEHPNREYKLWHAVIDLAEKVTQGLLSIKLGENGMGYYTDITGDN